MESLRRARWVRWGAPALVLAVAAALRLWALGRPGTLVFDELFYVRDAISQLAHGYPTTWPDSDPDMSGARATAFTDDASYAVHPPLGKWLIGLGILVFGPESGWGWRIASALAGVATVAVTMRLGWRLTRSLAVACLAGLLLAIDGVHVVLSRVGLLDGFLAFFIALGALFFCRDQEAASRVYRGGDRVPVMWRRPWLVAAALAFGAASSVKWSGAYPLAFLLVFATIRDLAARVRAGGRRRLGAAVGQGFATALVALPAALAVYVASWVGWIATAGGWGRDGSGSWPVALAQYHARMLEWHSTLSAPHPYASHPIGWPISWRPTAMYKRTWHDGCPWAECVSGISPFPNPLVTWGGVLALALLVWWAARAKPHLALAGAFVVTAYASGWLPWVLTVSRSAVFQFYTVVLTPFSAIALALVVAVLCRVPMRAGSGGSLIAGFAPLAPEALRGRRIAAAVFVAACLLLACFFFPVWSATPVAEWFWRAHLWLPAWA